MVAFNLILNKTYLGQELEDASYYFRIDFTKVLDMNKSMEADEFLDSLHSLLTSVKQDFRTVISKFEDYEIDYVYDGEYQVWQTNTKDIVISTKGILRNVTDFNEILRKIQEIKSFFLKNGIFLKIINYV